MDFKEQLKQDIDNVFINTKEFADNHEINGKSIPAIIDEEEHMEYDNLRQFDFDGIYKVKMTLYLDIHLVEKIPAVKSPFMVDGKKYFVLGALESHGLLKIILGVNAA